MFKFRFVSIFLFTTSTLLWIVTNAMIYFRWLPFFSSKNRTRLNWKNITVFEESELINIGNYDMDDDYEEGGNDNDNKEEEENSFMPRKRRKEIIQGQDHGNHPSRTSSTGNSSSNISPGISTNGMLISFNDAISIFPFFFSFSVDDDSIRCLQRTVLYSPLPQF